MVRMAWNILCDFDGTIATEDVTDSLLTRFADPAWQTIEAEWKAGRIGSRECMTRQVALIRATREDIDRLLDTIEIDPDFERAQRGLARAEEIQNQAKVAHNPFGRLVDLNPVKQAKTDIRLKKMTPEERIADRQFIRRTMIELQGLNQQMFEHLRDTLEEDLMQLNRGVQMSQKEVHKSLFDAKDKFQAAFQKFQNLYSQIRPLSQNLRDHEDGLKDSN